MMAAMAMPNITCRVILANVEMIRVNDGAARALHEACLRQTPDQVIGYT